jgi:hypothetical protein
MKPILINEMADAIRNALKPKTFQS